MRATLIGLTALALAGCRNSAASGGPDLQFHELRHDFGRVAQGGRVAHVFRFTNRGGDWLELSPPAPS